MHPPWQTSSLGRVFPLVLSPDPKLTPFSFVSLQQHLQQFHRELVHAVSEHGAVMFVGFDIANGEELASVLNATSLIPTPYVGGAAVRKLVVGSEQRLSGVQIVTTNESPPSEPIPFHNELAQTPFPPSHISFYSRVPAAEGGSTPLIRSDAIWAFIAASFPELADKFQRVNVRYIRRVPQVDDPSSAIGRSWRSMFHVQTPEEAEAAMAAQSYDFDWVMSADGSSLDCIIKSKPLPAVRPCSNGNLSFYNQVCAAFTGWVDSRNVRGEGVQFEDGSLIPADFMEALIAYQEQHRCVYPWTAGQLCIVDNSVAAHSRQPFTGKRVTYASIAQGIRKDEQEKKGTADRRPLSVTLSTGDQMPLVGLGLWKIPTTEAERVVCEALSTGYRLLDSACDYGNEAEVGRGIAKAIQSGAARREDIFVTSKLWNTYHRKEHVRAACERTLADLQLSYLDLYLVHFPIALEFVPFEERYPPGWKRHGDGSGLTQADMIEDRVPFAETWAAMEQLVRDGLVRNIGVCNMGTMMLRDLVNYASIKPAVLQVEMHPYNTQERLLRYCRGQGIAVTAFSNLGAGSYVALGMASVDESCLNEPVVRAIAERHGRTEAQIVLRWAIQRGTAVVPKTTGSERLKQNLAIDDFALDGDEMKAIAALNKNRRFNDPGHFCEAAFGTFFPIYD